MKLGLLTAILPDLDFRQVVDYCRGIGIEAVEVACWPHEPASRRYAGVSHLNIDRDSRAGLLADIQYARDSGVDISAMAYYPNPLSPDKNESQKAVEHIKGLIMAAAETGVDQVNTFIGRNRFLTVEENLKLCKEVWSPIVELAEKEGVRLAIENCPMYFSGDEWPGGNNLACSPVIWREIFRMIDSDKLGLNYDPSHQVIQDMDYVKPIYEFKDKIFHIHFKDVHIRREKLDDCGRFAYPLSFMTPKVPGMGDIDWAAVCRALYDIRYQGYACIEIEDKAFEDTFEDVDRAIRIAFRHMSMLM